MTRIKANPTAWRESVVERARLSLLIVFGKAKYGESGVIQVFSGRRDQREHAPGWSRQIRVIRDLTALQVDRR
jgi:hypothetical protein